ncbi:hypothetical protein [Kitasatospora sp. NPDC086791]|uniref:hypothetical protein n=1 Tax=Kitasatospora sp. NPDC086791 TaxID=3155178 RepID=UPI00343F7588
MNRTREQAIAAAGQILAAARVERDALTPEEAALAAWFPGHELGTVDAIRDLIVKQRARAAKESPRTASTPTISLPAAA